MPVLHLQAGTPLPTDLRHRFEPLLGADLGDVRVHTDSGAAAAAERLGAGAFTVGRNVFFAAGRFRPRSAAGLALLTHELIHVRQVSGPAPWGRLFSPPQERALEQQARQAARTLAVDQSWGAPLPITWSTPASLPTERHLDSGWAPQVANGAQPLILATPGRTAIVTALRQDASAIPPPPPSAPLQSDTRTAARSADEPPDLEAMGERLAGWLRRRERVERERSGVQRWS